MAKNGFQIMDSDIHVMEPPDLWLEYLPESYRDRAPRVEKIPATGTPAWRCENRVYPAFSDDPKRGRLNKARYDPNLESNRRYEDARHRRYDAKSQLDAMDVEGVDIALTFRTIGSHVIADDEMEPRFAAALCRAYNRWLADRCAEDSKRIKGAAIIPLHDVTLAVEEARFAVEELGHLALVLPSNMVHARPWYDESYEPVWQTACDLDVAVTFHGIQGAYQEHLGNRYLDNLMMMHAAAHPLELMLALGGLITGGVFDRHPPLRAAFLEGSCGWLPWWLWRLDEEQEKVGAVDRVRLKQRASEYFYQHCFVAVEPDEAVLGSVIDQIGDQNLVISTDWPHDDSAYPHAMDSFLALGGVSDDSKRKILWDNCVRLYDLKV